MFRPLIVALQFLTRLPTPAITDWRDDDLARSAQWFPVVGLIIGAMLAIAAIIGEWIAPSAAAILVAGTWVLVTGALHLDGLADTADGLAAAHGKPDRFLEVAKDPHVGAFGVVALTVILIAKPALLIAIPYWDVNTLIGLMMVPAWARWIGSATALRVPTLGSGSAVGFRAGLDLPTVAMQAVALTLSSLVVAPALVIAPAIAIIAIWYWKRRLGGVNGDAIGATIEVTETALLLALVVGHAIA